MSPSLRRAVSCAAALFLLAPGTARAAAPGASAPSLFWALPFAGLLLTVALAPLAAPGLWHRHYGKLAAFWALAFLAPFAAIVGPAAALALALRALVVEYLPFIAVLVALFAVAGGVRLTGKLRGTPGVNTLLLLLGTLAASIAGTTGAAMLLVRPLIRANRGRRHNRHVFVFLILLVGNVGGALSPLGDPPLFLGFLEGVPFFWPTRHLLLPTALVSAILLALFYLLDSYHHRHAPGADPSPFEEVEKLGMRGGANLLLLPLVLAIVMAGGLWGPGLERDILGVRMALAPAGAAILLLVLAAVSVRISEPGVRRANGFDWAAMIEVAILFAAIFVTIAPATATLRAGAGGGAASLIPLLNPGGAADDRAYFWVTGALSAVLDNAPTYLLFLSLAGGDAPGLAASGSGTLLAISAGAVFFGAMTYIGNAPNLMIKAIAEHGGIAMPGFFGYVGWAAALLLPPLLLVAWLFL